MTYPCSALWTYLHLSLRIVKMSGGKKKKREQERGALDKQEFFPLCKKTQCTGSNYL